MERKQLLENAREQHQIALSRLPEHIRNSESNTTDKQVSVHRHRIHTVYSTGAAQVETNIDLDAGIIDKSITTYDKP